jgi:predicted nucleotidyltransferase
MVSTAIIKSVQDYLRSLTESGLPVSFGVVFGSYAVGTADEESDIDVLVVSPQFDTKIERSWVNHLWRVAARTDSRIEPVPCGIEQWQNDTSSAIIEIARTEGKQVSLS